MIVPILERLPTDWWNHALQTKRMQDACVGNPKEKVEYGKVKFVRASGRAFGGDS